MRQYVIYEGLDWVRVLVIGPQDIFDRTFYTFQNLLEAKAWIISDAKREEFTVHFKSKDYTFNKKPKYKSFIQINKKPVFGIKVYDNEGFEIDLQIKALIDEIKESNKRLLKFGKSAFWLKEDWYI